MRLTTKSRYGTRMVIDIAINGTAKPVSITEISKRQNISLKYLEKLTRKLKKAGIIVSQRGPFGGHMLAKPPEDITIGDLVRTLEDTTAITDCAENDSKLCGECTRAGECISQWVWIEASKAMFSLLDRITIDSLLKKFDNGRIFSIDKE